jgi:retron-type reverse transcriptase
MKGKGLADAVLDIIHNIISAKKETYNTIYEFDLRSFFNTIALKHIMKASRGTNFELAMKKVIHPILNHPEYT